MPERKIDPKFNIHSNYTRVNIVNPYRYDSGGGSSGYEPETIMFMDATSTPDDATDSIYTGKTNHDCWVLLDNVIKYFKSEHVWDGIIHWHPMFGGTALKHSYNAKDINSFPFVFYNGWIHDLSGNKGNGTNTYASWGFIPSTQLEFENSGFSIAVLSDTGSTTSLELGSQSGSENRTYFRAKASGNSLTRLGGGTTGTWANNNAIGLYTSIRRTGTVTTFKNGVQKSTGNGGGSGLSTIESMYGAYNTPSPLSLFSDRLIGSVMHHKGENPLALNEGLRMWEEGLGRI